MTEQIMFWATVLSPIVGVIAIIVALIIAHGSSKDVKSQIDAINKQIDIFIATQNPNMMEAKKYYENQFDIYKYNTSACQQCWNCKEQIEHHCSGGCLSFKIQNIIKLRQFSESLAKKAPQANIASSRL